MRNTPLMVGKTARAVEYTRRADHARIDGASSVLVLPLAAPGIATVTVFQLVFVWNDYFALRIVIQKPSLFTVPLAIGRG